MGRQLGDERGAESDTQLHRYVSFQVIVFTNSLISVAMKLICFSTETIARMLIIFHVYFQSQHCIRSFKACSSKA